MSEALNDLTRSCIQCGFCLESCPTFIETGEESESPRGRISLIRRASEGLIGREAIEPHLASCLGCRACEPACPSGVQYGRILELARADHSKPTRGLRVASNPTLVRLGATLGRLGIEHIPPWLSGLPEAVSPPRVEPRAAWPKLERMPTITKRAVLLVGCVMKVMFPNVHEATARTLRRVGVAIGPDPDGPVVSAGAWDIGCCGALKGHHGVENGDLERLQHLAQGRTIIVNSAGCGSWLKDHGVPNVFDITEYYEQAGVANLLAALDPLPIKATYHDACHLAHGQRIRDLPRQLLGSMPGVDWIPLAESDLCCGSAGTYNLDQPQMARRLRDRKWANIEATGADFVVMGNPGCHAWLAQAALETGSKVRVVHTAEFIEMALSGSLSRTLT